MGDPSDEILMAFADGELSFEERARVAAIVAKRPDLQARCDAFTATGKVLATHFAKPMHEPPPAHLVDLVMGRAGSGARHAMPSVTATARAPGTRRNGVQRWLDRVPRANWSNWQVAMACASMFALGSATAFHFGRSPLAVPVDGGATSGLVATGPLAQALETMPSGIGTTDGAIRIVLSFEHAKSYCRQYAMSPSVGRSAAGLACRNESGRWNVQTHVMIDAKPGASGSARPAGADGSRTVGALVADLMQGDALGAAEEAALIALRWRRP